MKLLSKGSNSVISDNDRELFIKKFENLHAAKVNNTESPKEKKKVKPDEAKRNNKGNDKGGRSNGNDMKNDEVYPVESVCGARKTEKAWEYGVKFVGDEEIYWLPWGHLDESCRETSISLCLYLCFSHQMTNTFLSTSYDLDKDARRELLKEKKRLKEEKREVSYIHHLS